jgi:hypothetical protein
MATSTPPAQAFTGDINIPPFPVPHLLHTNISPSEYESTLIRSAILDSQSSLSQLESRLTASFDGNAMRSADTLKFISVSCRVNCTFPQKFFRVYSFYVSRTTGKIVVLMHGQHQCYFRRSPCTGDMLLSRPLDCGHRCTFSSKHMSLTVP